jgi:hypothetical protein
VEIFILGPVTNQIIDLWTSSVNVAFMNTSSYSHKKHCALVKWNAKGGSRIGNLEGGSGKRLEFASVNQDGLDSGLAPQGATHPAAH